MFYEELKENYTKVSFMRNPVVIDVVEVPKQISNDWRKIVIKVGITSAFIIFGLDTVAFANTLGEKAEELYYGKFLDIAKWLIIGKCGWDGVSKLLKEDFGGAKKSAIAALLMYALLVGLPWIFNEVDSITRG